ncbi:acyl-CoA synthetase [Microbacterium sp. SSM24]|uniref:acyl-CoA synthetase n=1 Tax=Microbacterium sp. SSM24 TaxID=2991714 RepID=UPI0022270BBD|nr:acyl-CoA synthetase [Microbacterium sp. SSM24]MCW3493009.1 acyl-CoA synthetase [Microbacterium sp. SSM24]
MTSASSARTFDVRHVQLARAAFAALAAIMITFSPDHSAVVGMAVFSGFAIATGLVLLLAVWIVYPAGRRWPSAALGGVTIVAGMVSGLNPVRTVSGFFAVVIAWAVVSGLIELLAGVRGLRGIRARREIAPGIVDARPVVDPGPRSDSRDAVVVGAVGLLLGVGLALVPAGYSLQYTIEEAHQTLTLTGITIGVGLFGAYAAIVAVYLGIAGFSPRKDAPVTATAEAPASVPAEPKDPA